VSLVALAWAGAPAWPCNEGANGEFTMDTSLHVFHTSEQKSSTSVFDWEEFAGTVELQSTGTDLADDWTVNSSAENGSHLYQQRVSKKLIQGTSQHGCLVFYLFLLLEVIIMTLSQYIDKLIIASRELQPYYPLSIHEIWLKSLDLKRNVKCTIHPWKYDKEVIDMTWNMGVLEWWWVDL